MKPEQVVPKVVGHAVRLNNSAFHHIGVACYDLDAEQKVLETLGYGRAGPEFFDPVQGIHGRFLTGGGPRLELLRNHEEPGVLTPWLKKGVKFYHAAYEIDAIPESSRELEALGAKQLVAPVPAVAFGGRDICFYMLPNLLLIELIARSSEQVQSAARSRSSKR